MPGTEKGKIVEKDVTVVVAGKTYKKVVHSQLTISYQLPTGSIDASVYNFWFAKGIGLIKSASNADFLGVTAASKSELLSYSVK